MKKIAILGAVALAALSLTACGQVDQGYAGLKINQYGSDKGLQQQTLSTGAYFTGFGTKIVEYPIFTKTYTFTRSADEGKGLNEEFTFQDKSGLPMSGDIGVMYHVDPTKVATLYGKFRVDQDQIVAGALRNAIRDTLITETSALTVEEIYGSQKAAILNQVQTRVQAYFAPYGLVVERLFWAGNIRMPDNVMQQINNRIANEQEALSEQAKVATVQAQAQQAQAKATGAAEALNIEGAAIRANPEVLKLRALERWNGVLPTTVTSGVLPFIDVGK